MRSTTPEPAREGSQQDAISVARATARSLASEMSELQSQQHGGGRWRRWGLLLVLVSFAVVCTATQAKTIGGQVGQPQSHRYLRESATSTVVELASSPSSSSQRQDRQLNIFGSDDRQEVLDPSVYPYSSVGLLRWNDDVTCTGSLVAETLVLTAAECVLESDGSVRASSVRKPQFLVVQRGGGAVRKAWITRVHKQSSFWTKWTRDTYVLLELDVALGATHGVLQLPKSSDFSQRTTGSMYVQMVSYVDAGTAAMAYETCSMHFPGEFDGPQYMVHHDCGMEGRPGPGSPMIVRSTSLEAFVVGIHSNAIGSNPMVSDDSVTYSRYDDDVANRGVLASFIQRHLDFLLQESSSLSLTSSLDVENSSDNDESPPSAASTSRETSPSLERDAQETDSSITAASSAASAALEQQTASEATSQALTDAMAYSCIGFVASAWVAIIFIAVRSTRNAHLPS